ncbi:MAG: lysophospholipid acyltransferase family protein [Deltaproteobacteria bacterium]|nr:lysophospholipid acyltransferase family protein [Deltaproteobacteria bacterium]
MSRSKSPGCAASLRALLVALLVTPLVWLLRLTWRVRTLGEPPPRGALFAYWHGDQLALVAAPLHRRPTVLVSRSRDGQWAALVARWLGFGVVRGSSSRGAVAGGLALARLLISGAPVGIAVDGPRGPRHQVRGAVERLARRTGAPLVPVAVACSRGLRLGSWDRLLIPAPFSTVVVAFGDPCPAVLQAALKRAMRRAADHA